MAGVSILKLNQISVTRVLKFIHFLSDKVFSLHRYICALPLLFYFVSVFQTFVSSLFLFYIRTGEKKYQQAQVIPRANVQIYSLPNTVTAKGCYTGT